MPRQIWNEGRVVGFSAYEVYLKHALSIDPNHEPATEKEWLASMMAMGSSMLLRIGTTAESYIDVPFPTDSRLCAANNILASVFTGEGYVGNANQSEHVWCTKVTDYGPLIANSPSRSPSTVGVQTAENIRTKDENISLSDIEKSSIREYMKILDGIIIQPGTWVTNSNKPPQKDFTPELAQVPTLRITFSEPVTEPFFILLTGFTNRSVVTGVTGFFDPQRPIDIGYDSAVNTQSPQDGDFLGPWAFPWAAKVIFSVPSAYISYFMNNKYTRELPDGAEAVTVKSDTIIDMQQSAPNQGYSGNWPNAPVSVDIKNINISGEDAAVLATYRQSNQLPPGLYGMLVNKSGLQSIYPIDSVSPGTIKLYHMDANIYTESDVQQRVQLLEENTPYNYGFYRNNATYVIYQLDHDSTAKSWLPVSIDETLDINGFIAFNTQWAWLYCHNAGGPPTYEQLQSVDSVIVAQAYTGHFSNYIMDKCAVPLRDAIKCVDAFQEGGVQMLSNVWSTIDTSENSEVVDQYSIIVASNYSEFSQGSQQISCMLCDNSTGAVNMITFSDFNISGLAKGINFTHNAKGSGASRIYDSNVTKYLGSYFGQDSGNYFDNSGAMVLNNHPHLHKSMVDYNSFYQPEALVPKFPPMYDNFHDWCMDVPFSDVLTAAGQTSEELGIHNNYQSLSLGEFLIKSSIRDVSKSDDDGNIKSSSSESKIMYLFPNSQFPKSPDSKLNLKANIRCIIPGTSSNFYSMRTWKFEELIRDKWVDITAKANRASSSIWSSHGQSGHKEATAISLVDQYGTLLPFVGNAGMIASDRITWDNLLEALNHNKSIDLLAGAAFRKNAQGINYLIMADGTRFYISKSKPTGDDIEDGSIGIGWEEE